MEGVKEWDRVGYWEFVYSRCVCGGTHHDTKLEDEDTPLVGMELLYTLVPPPPHAPRAPSRPGTGNEATSLRSSHTEKYLQGGSLSAWRKGWSTKHGIFPRITVYGMYYIFKPKCAVDELKFSQEVKRAR